MYLYESRLTERKLVPGHLARNQDLRNMLDRRRRKDRLAVRLASSMLS